MNEPSPQSISMTKEQIIAKLAEHGIKAVMSTKKADLLKLLHEATGQKDLPPEPVSDNRASGSSNKPSSQETGTMPEAEKKDKDKATQKQNRQKLVAQCLNSLRYLQDISSQHSLAQKEYNFNSEAMDEKKLQLLLTELNQAIADTIRKEADSKKAKNTTKDKSTESATKSNPWRPLSFVLVVVIAIVVTAWITKEQTTSSSQPSIQPNNTASTEEETADPILQKLRELNKQ